MPLLTPAIAICLGTVLSWRVDFNEWLWLGACGLAAVATIFFSFYPHRRLMAQICLCASVMCLGGGRFAQTYRTIDKNDLVTFADKNPIPATIMGVVSSYPELISPPKELGYRSLPTVKFLLDVESVKTSSGYVPATGICRVSVREPYSFPKPGDRVEIVGFLGRYQPADNPGQFDPLAQARLTGTFTWFTTPTSRGVTVLESGNTDFFWKFLWRLKSTIRQRLTETGDLQSGMMLSALLIGERHPALQDINRIMMRAGVAHYLSISGAHLAIFLGFIYLLCRLMMIGPRASAVIVLASLVWYLCLAQASAPLLRSAIMAACLAGGLAIGRRYSPLNALCAALIILLVIDPRQLLMPGFQLSFGIVLGLILFTGRFRRLMFGWWIQRRGLLVFTEKQRLRKWLNFQFADAVMDFISVCVCAYLISVPLAAVHFGFFSPYGMVLGALMAPLVVAILIPGYMAMALTLPMPNLAGRFSDLAGYFAGLMDNFMYAADRLPVLSITMRPVGVWWLVCFYSALLAVLYIGGRWWRKIVAAAAVLILAALTVFTQLPPAPTGDVRLIFLSVGYGQLCVMRLPDGKTWLLDGGSRSQADVYYRIYQPFLRVTGLPKPQTAVLSHPHPDHYNIMAEIYENDGFDVFYASRLFSNTLEKIKGPEIFDMWTSLHRNRNRNVLSNLKTGDMLDAGPGTKIEVLWPTDKSGLSNLNNTSLVLKITCGGRSAMLPGDIGEIPQSDLVKNQSEKLRADILVLPHHGGWTEALTEFVAAVNPKVIIASSAETPAGPSGNQKQGKRGREFFEKLVKEKRFFCTAKDGFISVDFGPGGIYVKTASRPDGMRF